MTNYDSAWSRVACAALFRDTRPTCVVRFVVCAGRLVASAAEADVRNVAHMLGLQVSVDKTVYEARRSDAH